MTRNKAVSYAVLALVDIAERGASDPPTEVRAAELATRLQLPTAYTAKVLGALARASLLRSNRGPRGGFQLAREPQQITLLDIIRAVGAWSEGELAFPSNPSINVRRSVNEALTRAMAQAQEALEEVYLSDLVVDSVQTPELVAV